MEKPKAKVFIDGANMFYTQKSLGWTISWKNVISFLENKFDVLETRYYTGLKEDDNKMLKYLRYLDKIGFSTITKILKKIKISNTGETAHFIFKANFDVEITADILLDKSKLDGIIIFSGDSDFGYLVKKLKDIGKLVYIFSSRRTISWELKLIASNVIYLEDIRKEIQRD